MIKKIKAPKKRRQKRDSRDVLLIFLAVITIAAVITAVWAVATRNRDGPGNDPQNSSETMEPVEKLTDGIDLPGYGALNFKADVLEQEVRIPNPPQNFCWIRASIILEDGTVLWTSELIAPGESSDPIVFTTTLAAGEYKNAILKYECFRMDETLTPLNGATSKLTLKVK